MILKFKLKTFFNVIFYIFFYRFLHHFIYFRVFRPSLTVFVKNVWQNSELGGYQGGLNVKEIKHNLWHFFHFDT